MKKRTPTVVVMRSFAVAAVILVAMVGCSSGPEDEPSTAPAATQSEAEAGLTYIRLATPGPRVLTATRLAARSRSSTPRRSRR